MQMQCLKSHSSLSAEASARHQGKQQGSGRVNRWHLGATCYIHTPCQAQQQYFFRPIWVLLSSFPSELWVGLKSKMAASRPPSSVSQPLSWLNLSVMEQNLNNTHSRCYLGHLICEL